MYKVFINNFPLFLASESETINSSVKIVDIKCQSKADAKKILDQHISSNGEKCYAARNNHLKELWKLFFLDYKRVKAAGGLVLNEKGQILFIFRNDKWDLPKGKIDPGEDEETAALREVNEECGLSGHRIKEKLMDTYHTYPLKEGKMAIKTTAWFLMKVKNADHLKPQTEEGITEVVWKSENEVDELMKNTYGSIKDVIESYLNR